MAMFSKRFKFKLGRLLITPGAIDVLAESHQGPETFLRRHQSGDWGNVCRSDRELNDLAIAHEGEPEKQGRVLSAYKTGKDSKIWIITEWDRSATTILLPSEY